jgi:hypothetical protein
MKAIDEIVAAAQQLTHVQFLRLRAKLDRLEKKVWEAELARTTGEMTKANVTDRKIDRLVMRRRRESRR